MASDFSRLLREYRRNARLTQFELGERAGLSARTISDLERGVHKAPFRHTVNALSEALGLTPEMSATLESSVSRIRAREGPLGFAPIVRPLTPIVGREREIELCTDLLLRSSARLVTLTGIGGVGKTRLALEVASILTEVGKEAGVARLGEVGDASELLPCIAAAMGVTAQGSEEAIDLIALRLMGQQFVVVVDSCDDVFDTRPCVRMLLDRCAGLQVLATSRMPLGLPGEHVVVVESLESPPVEPAMEEALASSAVRLFVDTARTCYPVFELTPANLGSVVGIVQRMDGLPLAIELAAGQASILTPHEILANLMRTAGPSQSQHESVREAIHWSYARLTDAERELLRFCALFPGSWSLGQLEIEGADPATQPVRGLLEPLVRSGLVQRNTERHNEARFRMLHLVKSCMLQELRERSELDVVQGQFADMVCNTFRREATTEAQSLSSSVPLSRLDGHEENLRAALEWQLTVGRPARGVDALWAGRFWLFHSHRQWATDWLGAVASSSGVEPLRRALATALRAAKIVSYDDSPASNGLLKDALMSLERLGLLQQARDIIQLVEWAPVLESGLRLEAGKSIDEFRQTRESARLGHSLASRAAWRVRDLEFTKAEHDAMEAVRLDKWLMPHADPRVVLAVARIAQGKLREAEVVLRAAIESLPSHETPPGPFMDALLGIVFHQQEDESGAADAFAQSLRGVQASGSLLPLGLGLGGAAWIALQREKYIDAASLLAAASRPGLPRAVRGTIDPYTGLRRPLIGRLGEAEFVAISGQAQLMPLEHAVALALSYLEA